MPKTFEERIKETKLTKTGQKIADYFLGNKSVLVFQSLSTIAKQLGISDISIVRFSRSLGYDGFTDLKQSVQNELISLIDDNPEGVNTMLKYITRKNMHPDVQLMSPETASSIYTDMILKTMQNNKGENFRIAAEHIIAGKNKYIIGLNSRMGAVITFSTYLQTILPNVIPITGDSYSDFLKLLNLSHDDCIILYSFGRLTKFEQTIINTVQHSKAYLITISDQNNTPAATAADLLFYSHSNTKHLFFSNVCNIMLAEILTEIITNMTWEGSKNRVETVDSYLNQSVL